MKKLLRIAKKSAREIFKNIQTNPPFFCSALDVTIIITKGILLEKRKDSFLIGLQQGNDIFCVVILKNKQLYSLLSCFVRNEKRRNLSRPPMVHHIQKNVQASS